MPSFKVVHVCNLLDCNVHFNVLVKLLIAVPAEGSSIICKYMYVAGLHPSKYVRVAVLQILISIDVMERMTSLQLTLTLT